MADGVFGTGVMETTKDAAVDAPQALFAVTEIVPLEVPVTAVIEFVVDVPVQPFGRVHV